jgi:hypothetical protein
MLRSSASFPEISHAATGGLTDMTYEEFKSILARHLEHLLAPGTSMQIQTICKNNGLKLDGLTLSSADSNVSPTVFLNYYYEKQGQFADFNAICQDILLTYENSRTHGHINADFFTDYEQVKQHLSYRLIHYEKNKELLETVPYVRYLDLAIVFFCLVHISPESSATILIHTSHLKLWNINAAKLYGDACESAPQLLPYHFQNMTAVLSDVFGTSAATSGQDIEGAENPLFPMYVLTNSQKLYGAACLLYPKLLDRIADRLGSDLFILPSSIHETVLIPACHRSHSKALAAMVADINRSELSPDEVLSDSIYYYSRTEHALTICT